MTLGGARNALLRRQARAVPLSVSAPPARGANGTIGRAAAAQGPVFTYQPFVTAAGAPVPPGAVDEALKLPQLAARAESASAEAEQPISIRNGQLYGVDGQPLVLKGINWRAGAPRWRIGRACWLSLCRAIEKRSCILLLHPVHGSRRRGHAAWPADVA